MSHRSRHKYGIRLHDPGPGRSRGSAAAPAGCPRRGCRSRRPRRHRGLRRSADGQPTVRAGHAHRRRPVGMRSFPRHARARDGQRVRRVAGRRTALRCDAGRHRRVPACARRERQRRDRRRRLPVREHGNFHRARLRQADRAPPASSPMARRRSAARIAVARRIAEDRRHRARRTLTFQETTPMTPSSPLPLAGLRVVEFTHMVMGPTCGMVLADMGAEVIKVEPIDGDRTRRLLGAGSGFFPMFNRNKKSIAIDLRNPQGAEVARKLAASADVVAENFKPGTMSKYGLDYASLAAANPRLIYVTHKGFLPGPYDHRTALDEVVQMMGGLAYMTGRPGDPLRAGTSVNDIMGGLFAAI